MNLIEFSENELNNLLTSCKDSDEYNLQNVMNKSILEIIKKFSEQHFTGTTSSYCINILIRLLNYKPLTPLTGEDSEWEDIQKYGSENTSYQNKRCPAIFKDSEGKAYNVESKIFSDDNGKSWYTCSASREYIDFPYIVPDRPEMIYNKVSDKRFAILNELNDILKIITTVKDLIISEDDNIYDFVTNENMNDFINQINEKWKMNITKESINNNEYYIWEIINLILENVD